MLVLSRRPKESIKIGDEITITVLSVHTSEVRLGISAPKNVMVHRSEVYARIQEEKNKQIKETEEE